MALRVRRSCLLSTLAVFCLLPFARTQTVPTGVEIQIRLTTRISSTSMAGERVEAVVIAPVVAENRILIPAGSEVFGCLRIAKPSADPDQRAVLAPEFFELGLPDGDRMPLSASLVEVENARETVDEDGRVLGILESETLTARMDRGLEKLSGRFAKFAEILQVAKSVVLNKAETEITYEPGVEMRLALRQPIETEGKFPGPELEVISPFGVLYSLVNALPFQTTAESPPKPSDLTNLMFIGSGEQVEAAFTEAGWTTAEKLNAMSGLETFRAVVENRGYKEAPMSVLLLDGRKPDMVFQKQLNTFAKRHHLRIWKRPERFGNREVWVCAATHDIGISFSAENRTFIHDIDPQIDRERAKVVSDLVFTGRVKALALVDRPAAPTSSENATGDKIETDGRIAALLLR